MRFSVLMSVYKRDNADFLREALVSIYEGQTRKPDEIVVIFDGPLTEALYNVLDEYAKDKNDVVRYFPQEVNKGLGEALRIGVGYCTGDYIFRMDSDDVCHQGEGCFSYSLHYALKDDGYAVKRLGECHHSKDERAESDNRRVAREDSHH